MTTRILCFGDSNTWGYIPGTGKRFARDIRWTGQLEKLFAAHSRLVEVIEDGVNGRTTQYPVLFRSRANAYSCLEKTLKKNTPLDIVVLALGINDLKSGNAQNAAESARGMLELVEISKRNIPNCKIVLISPPELTEKLATGVFSNSSAASKELPRKFSKIAAEEKTLHLATSKLFSASKLDAIHYDAKSHGILASALVKMLLPIC